MVFSCCRIVEHCIPILLCRCPPSLLAQLLPHLHNLRLSKSPPLDQTLDFRLLPRIIPGLSLTVFCFISLVARTRTKCHEGQREEDLLYSSIDSSSYSPSLIRGRNCHCLFVILGESPKKQPQPQPSLASLCVLESCQD